MSDPSRSRPDDASVMRVDGLANADLSRRLSEIARCVDTMRDELISVGLVVDAVSRHGKWIALETSGGLSLVFHLSRAGWLRWSDALPTTVLRPGKSPIAPRVRFDDGSGFDLTEAGTQKRLAVHIVRDVVDVPGIAKLGIDPLSPEFTREAFGQLVASRRMQIKGLLRDQNEIAGVGNAYSDEVLHVARLSPFALAAEEQERVEARAIKEPIPAIDIGLVWRRGSRLDWAAREFIRRMWWRRQSTSYSTWLSRAGSAVSPTTTWLPSVTIRPSELSRSRSRSAGSSRGTPTAATSTPRATRSPRSRAPSSTARSRGTP